VWERGGGGIYLFLIIILWFTWSAFFLANIGGKNPAMKMSDRPKNIYFYPQHWGGSSYNLGI